MKIILFSNELLIHATAQDLNTPLHGSAKNGLTATCAELIKHGADVSAKDSVSSFFFFFFRSKSRFD